MMIAFENIYDDFDEVYSCNFNFSNENEGYGLSDWYPEERDCCEWNEDWDGLKF